MKVEIWSDVMCPFCYIGKRKFEAALSEFESGSEIEVEWKSYQLNPGLIPKKNQSLNEYLAEQKGWTADYAKQLNQHVSKLALEAGLQYDLEHAVVANTFNAHLLLQLAILRNKGPEIEEKLFASYFTERKDIGDRNTLIRIGLDAGLSNDELDNMFENKILKDAVYKDLIEAEQLGIKGVPFFVFNRKYAVSGAQAKEVFLETLNTVSVNSNA